MGELEKKLTVYRFANTPLVSEMQKEMEKVSKEYLGKCASAGIAPTRTFETGATRNSDADKYDYEGFLSPLVIERFGKYMHKHRHLADGSMRDSDNWQKGLPYDVCVKSLLRHVIDVWKNNRNLFTHESVQDALCAVIFNAQALLLNRLQRMNLAKAEEDHE